MRFRALLALTLSGLALLPAVTADEKKADKEDKAPKKLTVAHIKLSGGMDEKAPSVDPLLGSLGETFKEKLDRIKKAKGDKDVHALLLEVDGLSVGWGQLDELSRAVAEFRKSGKKAFAYIESGTTKDYLLALACDDVCLPESSWLMLTGLRLEATFFKGLLDKLGVKADMMQMEEYKGAIEPFTRESLSKPNREQLERVLDDYYEKSLVARIVKGRPAKEFTPAQVKKLIDAGPYSAKAALKAGLVDRLDYDDSYEGVIKKALEAEEVKVVRDYGKKKDEEISIFSLYRKLLFGPSKATASRKDKVAVIYATGAITTGKSGSSLLGGDIMGSETMVKAIREAEKDKTVKAIVLRVDSPGGSAMASDLIWKELTRCKKPVVASMSDVAASGGYYISMAARKIYAEPGTLTGSIGVASGKLALGGAFAKVGIKTETIKRGAHAGMFSSEEPFSESERARMRALMEDVYDQFLDKALEGRKKAGKKMTRAELKKLAGGRIYTGRQAKANGLIDELGTLDDAIAAAWKMAGQPADKEPDLLQLPKPRGMFESLFESLADVQA